MKKYKIRVRVLPENICCGFIIEGEEIISVYTKVFDILVGWGFGILDTDIISIGEL